MPHILSYILIGLFGLMTMAMDPADAAGTSDEATESEAAPAYKDAKARIDAEDYAGALPMLEQLTADQPDYADAWNLRGFANRKLGNLDAAAEAYATALKINPGHLGALEYQGEMFLELKQTDKAMANLKTLQGLCGDCDEANDLAEAISMNG